jgi:para-nitrobenzyl esterase
MKSRSLVFPILLVLGFLHAFPAAAHVLNVATPNGSLQGVLTDDVVAYKGIPFAAPPIGDLRWRAPQPAGSWSGMRKADRYAASCMQDPAFLRLFGAPPEMSEDCLYLNVWTGAKSADERRPVMVWIYGGGFRAGSTALPSYDGQQLAKMGVVLVSIAYRTGAFGFLAHPELSDESGKGSGTFGLQDQIAGLEWVKANIKRFGGDPARVTIFGQSAGAVAVSMLAASPRAKGLFQRVIAQSGGSFAPPLFATAEGGLNVPVLKAAEEFGQRFLERLGATGTESARALSAEVIQKAVGGERPTGFWPALDGHILPGDQYELYLAGRFNDTPVLIGTNSDEGTSFVSAGVPPEQFEQQIRAGFGGHADAILAVYPHANESEATKATKDFFRDCGFGWHTWTWARVQSQKGQGRAFLYYYDLRTPQWPGGVPHGAEVDYVFRNLGKGVSPASLTSTPRPEDLAMSDLLSRYWVNFAKSGDPNGRGLPRWPAFTPSAEQAMIFDAKPGAGPVPNMRQLNTLDTYYAWRRASIRH